MLFALMSSEITVESIWCSDINFTLINVWEMIRDRPQELLDYYIKRWPFDKDGYYSLRAEFNATHDPRMFFCLLRTCRNGLVRFNKQGEFTSAFHLRRKGINPERLEPVLMDWSQKLQQRKVHFSTVDYQHVQSEPGDFMYIDPPYLTTEDFYYGLIELEPFWEWLRQQSAFALSFNGDAPSDLYDVKALIPAGFHRFNRLDRVEVQDNLYVRGVI
jgi:DNA adenine methylase